jgi:hypothetical protein
MSKCFSWEKADETVRRLVVRSMRMLVKLFIVCPEWIFIQRVALRRGIEGEEIMGVT